jgi:Phage endonuclease I
VARDVLWRSQYERKIREWLDARGVPYQYEEKQFILTLKVPGQSCEDCGSKRITRETTYTPDFYFPKTLIIVEAKGKFDARARKVALAMREQYPDYDYRILLQRDNWLTSGKKQRYSDWLTKQNIKYAVGPYPPIEWCVPPGSFEPQSVVSFGAGSSTARKRLRRKC